jgi:hypothetical protein
VGASYSKDKKIAMQRKDFTGGKKAKKKKGPKAL